MPDNESFIVSLACKECGEEGRVELGLPMPLNRMPQAIVKEFRDIGWDITRKGDGFLAVCPSCRTPARNPGKMDATYRVLEKRFSIYLLNLIYQYPGMSKMFYKDFDEGFRSTKNGRLAELEDAGLIRSDSEPRNHGSVLLYCTDAGESLAKAFKSARKTLPEVMCEPAEY